jgi:hypothetical protein
VQGIEKKVEFSIMVQYQEQDKCAMCGKSLAEQQREHVPVVEEIIDSSRYLFDTRDCANIFKRLGVVYGSTFYDEVHETTQA